MHQTVQELVSQLLFSLCELATTPDTKSRKEVHSAILFVSTKPVSHNYLHHQLIQLYSDGTVRVHKVRK
jgi:hypothetical protein